MGERERGRGGEEKEMVSFSAKFSRAQPDLVVEVGMAE